MTTRDLWISKIDDLNFEAWKLVDSDPNQGLILSQLAFDESQKYKYQKGLAESLRNRGVANIYLSNQELAKELLDEGVAVSIKIGNQYLEANCIHNLGLISESRSEYKNAIKDYLIALKILEEIGEVHRGITTLNNLGTSFKSLGDYRAAIGYFQRALEISRVHLDTRNEALVLANIGLLHEANGQFSSSIICFNTALELCEALKFDRLKTSCLESLSGLHLAIGEPEEALVLAAKAQKIAEYLDIRFIQAYVNCALARAHAELGNSDEAILLYKSAIQIASDIEDRTQVAEISFELGSLLFRLENFELAQIHLFQTAEIAKVVGAKKPLYQAHQQLAKLFQKEQKYDLAFANYEQFHLIEREVLTVESDTRIQAMMIEMDVEKVKRESELHRLEAEMHLQNRLTLESLNSDLQSANCALEEANKRLERLATTDSLTGAYNRRYGQQHLATAYKDALRYHKPLSILLVDIDRFKFINDNFGHAIGDKVLIDIVGLLERSVASDCTLSRWGGEEFLITAPGADSFSVCETADRIKRIVEGFAWTLCPVTISVGAATLTSQHTCVENLVKDSDVALYCSKKNGRNRVTHIDFYEMHVAA